jgi:hypothetical protein
MDGIVLRVFRPEAGFAPLLAAGVLTNTARPEAEGFGKKNHLSDVIGLER